MTVDAETIPIMDRLDPAKKIALINSKATPTTNSKPAPTTNPKTSTDPDHDQRIPAVNCSASRDSTGAIHISLVNLDPSKTITIRTAIDNLISKTVTGQILTSAHYMDVNTFSQPDKIKSAVFNGAKKQGGELVVILPPKSVVVLELK
jgi:alpha-L-arabinofuranosidase